MILPAASTDDLAFIQSHTASTTAALKRRLHQTKQVHAAAGPVCTVVPVVTGTPTVGQILTCAPGTWLNAPALTRQWRRRGIDITGATALTYTLVAADSGNDVNCMETGTNGTGVATARSNSVAVP